MLALRHYTILSNISRNFPRPPPQPNPPCQKSTVEGLPEVTEMLDKFDEIMASAETSAEGVSVVDLDDAEAGSPLDLAAMEPAGAAEAAVVDKSDVASNAMLSSKGKKARY